ncbi:MAG: TolC family protein, partial [Rhodanobacter sp.]
MATIAVSAPRPMVACHSYRGGWRTSLLLSTVLVLTGCATFADLPLSDGHGASSVARLSAPTSAMPLPALAAHRFDPSDGLDATEVAMLAVANSPALRLKRDELGLARAQSFAAGLLPDPQLSLGEDFPQHSGPGLTTAFNLGIATDITALLTRSSRTAEARSHVDQVNLDLLWAEWQTVTQARQL